MVDSGRTLINPILLHLCIELLNPRLAKIKKIDIEAKEKTHGPNPCPVCVEQVHPFFSKVAKEKPDKVSYKKVEVDSGVVPTIRKCTTYANGKQKCRTIKGFRQSDFAELERL